MQVTTEVRNQLCRKVPIEIPDYAVEYGRIHAHKSAGLLVQTYLSAYSYKRVFRYIDSLVRNYPLSYKSMYRATSIHTAIQK